MNYGKIIKKLRKERNLTQEQLCKGITSRVALSDFETKNTRISFETLTLYLDRMNIRLDEFVLLYVSEDLPFIKKRKIANRFPKITRSGPKSILQEIERLIVRYEETEDIYYYLLMVNLKVFLLSEGIGSESELKEEIAVLMAYLTRIDTFGRFEIVMLSNCITIFSEEFLLVQHAKIVNKLRRLITDPLFQHDLTSYANNLCIHSLQNNYSSLLAQGIQLLKEISEDDPRNIYERLLFRLFKECSKKRSKNKETLDEILQMMSLLGMEKLASEYKYLICLLD